MTSVESHGESATPMGGHDRTQQPAVTPKRHTGRLARTREAIGAVVGAALGLVPHVLHHIGLLAGAALISGATGNMLFFIVGLIFSVPLLLRLRRRFHTWRAPAGAVVVFAALFSLSAFVIGPAITGSSGSDNGPGQPGPTQSGHDQHHS